MSTVFHTQVEDDPYNIYVSQPLDLQIDLLVLNIAIFLYEIQRP